MHSISSSPYCPVLPRIPNRMIPIFLPSKTTLGHEHVLVLPTSDKKGNAVNVRTITITITTYIITYIIITYCCYCC